MYRYVYWFKRSVPQNYQPVVVITGCGSGLGLALADLFYQQPQYRVVITARSHHLRFLRERFAESTRFSISELDITDEASRASLVESVNALWGGVDILVNNAGISYRSVVEHMTSEDEQLQMATNYLGPMALIRLVLPKMRERGRGKIINISSVSGMLAMPTMSSYSASKYALEGASEALWYELKPFGINVSLIQPGFIHSKSFKNVYYSARALEEEKGRGPYTEYYTSMSAFVEKLMERSFTEPTKIARLVLDVVQTQGPPLWVPASFDAEFFYYLRRLTPRRLLLPILYRLLPNSLKWGKRFTHKRPFRLLRFFKFTLIFSKTKA